MSMGPEKRRVMIVAGEASGDLHGGNLAAALGEVRPGLGILGMGGEHMRRAGVEILVDNSSVAVVGLWEVLAHFRDIKAAYQTMKEGILSRRPSLLVLIDYPEFNLRLARVAKSAGVPVVYYISPQIWAWRRGRVKKIASLVRKMLVVFPFEEKFYRDAGIDCRFVGHPLLDAVGAATSPEELAGRVGLDPGRPILGILPGSRRKELANHLPVMLESFRLLKKKITGLQGIIPVAETLTPADFTPHTEGIDDLALVEHDIDGVMSLMDAAVVASGTATLQTALHQKPMAIVYRLSPLTYFIGRRLIKVKHIGIVNIVAGEEVVPEFIQHRATPENIVDYLTRIFEDREYRDRTVEKLNGVRARLGSPGASRKAAREILDLLG